MDKEGEQTPAGGIDLRGRLTVMRSCLLFSWNKEQRGGSYSSPASQPTAKLV